MNAALKVAIGSVAGMVFVLLAIWADSFDNPRPTDFGQNNQPENTIMSEAAAPSLRTVMEAPLKATGADIPPASYGATLLGFGEPFRIATSEKFRKPGQPAERNVFEANFALLVKDQIQEIAYMMPLPDGGATNRKSNLFKMLRALGSDDPALFAPDGDAFAADVTLAKFIGKACIISVKRSEKDFPQVESVAKKMAGVKYPDIEEARKALSVNSEGIPF